MARLSDLRVADWFEQVADGLDAGMTASDAVAMSKALPNGASEQIEETFRAGSSWAEVLDTVDLSLSFAEVSVLKASDLSAKLPAAMRRLAKSRQELAKVKRRILLLIAYPVFLLHFAAIVFSVSYLVNGDIAAFFVSAGMVILPVWLIGLFLFSLSRFWPSAVRAMSRGIPLVAAYRKNWDAGTFCDVLSSCLGAGMEVQQAWQAAVAAADHPHFYKIGESALHAMSFGKPASLGIAKSGDCAPKGFLELYRTGETTGKLEQNLAAASKRYFDSAKANLLSATVVYPAFVFLGIAVYIGYKIVTYMQGYYQQLMDIGA